MSFWEELGQRITQGGQGAFKKTKEIAGVMTMNADISDSKRKIRDLHEELGRILVDEAFSDLTANQINEALEAGDWESLKRTIDFKDWNDILTKVMYIKSEEEVIAINEEKIRSYKEEERCPSCGRKIGKNMAFCPDCGTRIVHADSAAAEDKASEKDEPAESAPTDSVPENAAPEENKAAEFETFEDETIVTEDAGAEEAVEPAIEEAPAAAEESAAEETPVPENEEASDTDKADN